MFICALQGTQFLGRVKCAEAGMNFAKIDSPEEIAWLSWLLPPSKYTLNNF